MWLGIKLIKGRLHIKLMMANLFVCNLSIYKHSSGTAERVFAEAFVKRKRPILCVGSNIQWVRVLD